MASRRARLGFTLIEMLVVIAIIDPSLSVIVAQFLPGASGQSSTGSRVGIPMYSDIVPILPYIDNSRRQQTAASRQAVAPRSRFIRELIG